MAFSISSATILLLSAAALTTPVTAVDSLNSGQFLGTGHSLTQGLYLFIMLQDCNLVLYDNNVAIWATGTTGLGSGCLVTLQSDGNLVIYGGGIALWASNSNGQVSNYILIVQTDGNVVIYDNSNNAIWETGTNVDDATVVANARIIGTVPASGGAKNKTKELYP